MLSSYNNVSQMFVEPPIARISVFSLLGKLLVPTTQELGRHGVFASDLSEWHSGIEFA